MNSQNKKHFTTRDLVVIGLFAAICYVVLYFRVPIPSPVGKPFLHFGNMVVIIAALLFGGVQGGLAGAVG
ncbi:MAG: ECF transporter S component, partial [Bacillota bacterium]|nr:ECF transporter S component [Bacillota bacterium]